MFTETFLPDVNGIVTTMLVMLDHLQSIGADVIIFTPENNSPDNYQGYPVVAMPSKPSLFYEGRPHSLPSGPEWTVLKDFNPDLVHLWQPTASLFLAVWFARRLNVPLLMSFHVNYAEAGRYYGYGGRLAYHSVWHVTRITFNMGDLTLAPSTFTAGQMAQHGLKRVQVWTHGVNPSNFAPHFASRGMRERLTNNHPERPLLLYVGRIAHEKRVGHLKSLVEHLPDVHLAIVGDGPAREELQALFPSQRTTFTGVLHGDELASAYASADLFLFPTSNFETFGITALEALMSGIPVVGSNVAGMVDLVVPGQNGYLFETEKIDQMVDFTRQVIAEPSRLAQMKANARPSVQKFTWDIPKAELVTHYETLILNHKGRHNWYRLLQALLIFGIAYFQWFNATAPRFHRLTNALIKK